MKKALITGISGQDGSYLAEHLLEQGYEVHGMVRRLSVAENQSSRLDRIINDIQRHYGDMLDELSISRIVQQVQPDEIYNLAAMSHVRISFDVPAFAVKTNGLGVLYMLDAARSHAPEAKFYQASSSEMFGNSCDADGMQRLTTPMNPVSPYGAAKVIGYNLTRHYRNAYKMHACNGVLFNHESPRRGSNFVTNKVVKTAVQIKLGLTDKLVLGNMDSERDWGHSYDYVRAMHKIITHHEPSDWIVATGVSHSVRHLCDVVFNLLGMNYLDYVVQDPAFMRPEELKKLCGDASDIKKYLHWEPKYTFETMLAEMVAFWMDELNR